MCTTSQEWCSIASTGATRQSRRLQARGTPPEARVPAEGRGQAIRSRAARGVSTAATWAATRAGTAAVCLHYHWFSGVSGSGSLVRK